MTSPSETPLDLDELCAGIDVLTEDAYYSPWSDEWALEMKRDLYRLVSEARRSRELESRPRTVGDLTARDLGRRVRIEHQSGYLCGMEWRDTGSVAHLQVSAASWWVPLDTPVEFPDDEPASVGESDGARAEDAGEGQS